jgi:hypothetical protein
MIEELGPIRVPGGGVQAVTMLATAHVKLANAGVVPPVLVTVNVAVSVD